MADYTCLAEGLVVPADFKLTGINQNEIIIGPTGSGKTFSCTHSRLVHTTESSVVVPLAKKSVKEKFSQMFWDRGYEVVDLDFTHPESCTTGYDPLDYVKTDEDVIHLAKCFVGVSGPAGRGKRDNDPFWDETTTNALAAEIALVRLNAMDAGKRPCFADVVKLHKTLKCRANNQGLLQTNLDEMFEWAGQRHPGNQATTLWNSIKGVVIRTMSIVMGMVNNALTKAPDSVLELCKKENRISFDQLGKRKIALFITTSPVNSALQEYVNILYADLFKSLFETAEENEDGRLDVPVHVICDDFACGSRINDFENYISIFRAAGISCTLLLQSIKQLSAMYGEMAATTIMDNSDTLVYMGSNNYETAREIAQRWNKPINRVIALPLEHVLVFRRGSEPYEGRRYQTLNDPLYRQVMNLDADISKENGQVARGIVV